MDSKHQEHLLQESELGNVSAENAILGAMLIHKNVPDIVFDALKPTDFVRASNIVLFEAMHRVYDRGESLNSVSLNNELKLSGRFNDAGGAAALLSLLDMACFEYSVENNIRIIKDYSLRRAVALAGRQIYSVARDGNTNVADILNHAEMLITNVDTVHGQSSYVTAANVCDDAWSHMTAEMTAKDGISGIRSGFKDLDEKTAGFHAGQYVIFGARPSMGKTALACNMALTMLNNGHRVGFVSLEMPKENILQRMILMEAKVSKGMLRKPGPDKQAAINACEAAKNKISGLPFCICDTPGMKLQDLRSVIRRMVTVDKAEVVFIDYVQLIDGSNGNYNDNRQQEMTRISKAIAALKKELKTTIVALAQLNREVTGRMVKRPVISDIKESGAFEQDADIIVLIHREDYYRGPDEQKDGITNLILAKNRDGATGDVNVHFIADQMRFIGNENIAELQQYVDGSSF